MAELDGIAQLLQSRKERALLNPFTAAGQNVAQQQATTSTGSAFNDLAAGILNIVGARKAQNDFRDSMSQLGPMIASRNYQGLLADPETAMIGASMLRSDQDRMLNSTQKIDDLINQELIKFKFQELQEQSNSPRARIGRELNIAGSAPGASTAGDGTPIVGASPLAGVAVGQDTPNVITSPTFANIKRTAYELNIPESEAANILAKQNEPLMKRQEAEQKQKDDYLKVLKDEETAANTLLTVGQTVMDAAPLARSGAGQTITGALVGAGAFLGGEEASKAYLARSKLQSIGADVVANARSRMTGAGSMDRQEMMLYQASGPNVDKPQEENIALATRYLIDGTLGKQSVEFKRWFLQQPGTTVAQVEDIWGAYVNQVKQSAQTADQVPDWKQALLPKLTGQAQQQPQIEATPPTSSGGAPPGFQMPGGGSTPSSNGLDSNALLSAIEKVESGGNPSALSPKGAQGAFQFMPETAKEYAAKLGIQNYNPANKEQQAEMAAAYLADNLERFNGSIPLAVASYNAGPGAVQRAIQQAGSEDWNQVARFLPAETQNYVPKVLSSMGGQPNEETLPIARGVQTADAQPPATPQEMALKDKIVSTMGEVGQGLTFGLVDEAAAGMRSILPGYQDYESELAAIRGQQKQFREENPGTAVVANIGGAIANPANKLLPFGRGATALGSVVKNAFSGGVSGAAYGAGEGEGDLGRLTQAAKGGALGAAGGAAISAAGEGIRAGYKAAAPFVNREIVPLIKSIPESTKQMARGMFASPEAGKLKISIGGSGKSSLTPAEAQVLRLAESGGTKSEDLIKALNALDNIEGKGVQLTLPEALSGVDNPRVIGPLADQLDELANRAETSKIVDDFIRPRSENASTRISQAFSSLGEEATKSGGSKSLIEGAKEVSKLARQQLREVAAPAYAQMEKAAPVLESARIKALVKSPTIRTYIKSAQNDFTGEKLPANSSRIVKEALSAMRSDLEKMRSSVGITPRAIRKFENDFLSLKKEAYKLNPAMKEADRAYAEAMASSPLKEKGLRALEVLQSGDEEKAIPLVFRDLNPEQISALRSRFFDAGQGGNWNQFVTGWVRSVLDKKDLTTIGRVNQALAEFVEGNANRARLTAAVGEDAAPRIFEALKVEKLVNAGRSSIAENSRTAKRLAAKETRERAIGFISRIIRGDKVGAAKDAFDALVTKDIPAEQLQGIAQVLLQPREFIAKAAPRLKAIEQTRAQLEAAGRVGSIARRGASPLAGRDN